MKKYIIMALVGLAAAAGCKPNTTTQQPAVPPLAAQPPVTCRPQVRVPSDYFMMLGSFQAAGKDAHTFGVFCRFEGDTLAESRTISWMPQSLNVKVLKRDPEPGVNLTYKQTRDIATRNGYSLFFRGPYKIEPELYNRACEQATELESGKVLYKSGDSQTRPAAVNSTHAISDIDREFGHLRTGASTGSTATSIVERHLFRWVIQDKKDYTWVVGKLNADATK